jgi:hypothetical protein
MKYFSCFFLLVLNFTFFSQKYIPFQGKISFEVNFTDSLNPSKKLISNMIVYTNDTLVRIETENPQLGKQILIKNIPLNKYYILLEIDRKKYAIQHYITKDTLESKFTFRKRFGSKKISGFKANKMELSHKTSKNKYLIYYLKNINPIYTEAIKGLKGLPVEYYIQTEEGMYFYQLKEIKEEIPNKNLFGIPSDFKRLTFDDFILEMSNSK